MLWCGVVWCGEKEKTEGRAKETVSAQMNNKRQTD